MIIVAVCDDQETDRMHLKHLIESYGILNKYDLKVVLFESGEALEKYYIMNSPLFDIVFLDIYMGGMTGLVAAKKIRTFDGDCKIIFSTSSTEHALESFEVFPFQYLIKPIAKDVFGETFAKALKHIDGEKEKTLLVKIGTSLQTVYFKDITYLESDAKVLTIHMTSGQTFTFAAKLDDLQAQLQDSRFNRCHKSFLVNMDHISSVENHAFKLINQTFIPITQRNYVAIKKVFYDYLLAVSHINTQFSKGGN